MDRKFLLAGFAYGILGLMLGIFMAASKDHGQLVTHAHIMLLGFVVSFIYALCHKLWLANEQSKLSKIQFLAHQAGTLVLLIGLFLMYGGIVSPESADPVLAVSSIVVFIGLLLMTILLARSPQTA